MSEQTPLETILTRVLDGDSDAFAEVVRRYQKDVWRVVVSLLHNFDASQELVEQVFVEAYLSLDQFERGKDFSFWIKGVARNVVREELRKKTRESKRLEVYRDHLIARLDDDAQAESHESELKESLAGCREKLPEVSARALDLRYRQGKSFEEIAEEMGRTVEATRQLLSRVRILLRDCIDRRMAQV
ncbi:MAG TPA: sigma-70 family RNA polymerase sigma factor [Planctomycetota bacterium]|nr:sigma-70 family RNA polymerase sigma factor [Planctomycetota bacterium]